MTDPDAELHIHLDLMGILLVILVIWGVWKLMNWL
jgi:hypothetical protein